MPQEKQILPSNKIIKQVWTLKIYNHKAMTCSSQVQNYHHTTEVAYKF